MIVVQDKIEVPGDQLMRLQQLFREQYIPAASQRGLQFFEFLTSPPVRLKNAPSTCWARWHVTDAVAWWGMRAQSGNPAVTAFWHEVDSFCSSRERIYLTSDGPESLPQAEDVSQFAVKTRGYRETAQLALQDGVNEKDRTELEHILRRATTQLPGLKMASLGSNFAPEYAAGHYTWDLLYPNREASEVARLSAFWQNEVLPALERCCVACHVLDLDTIDAGVRRPDLTGAVKRTAYFRMLPGTTALKARQFEQDLLEMPGQIPEILNWRLSRASALPWDTSNCDPWTYVWEQEFASLDNLLGPYMTHPHHWAHIDRWFDPESGVQAVDVHLSHAFCTIDKSILSDESD